MVWLGSFLLLVLVGGGVFAMAVVRHRLQDEGGAARELPPDMLISIARAHDADLARRATDTESPADRGAEI